MRKGILCAISAYIVWGLLPIYLKMMQHIAPLEILLHRMLWSLVFLMIVLTCKRHFRWIKTLVKNPKIILFFIASAISIAINWFIYIWSVNNNHVVDASLGYFLLPLVNVTLGYFILKERLRAGQWCAVAIAALGVLWLAIDAGQIPWIAFSLAITFGIYGLLRKTAALETLEGLSLETAILAPFALSWLIFMAKNNHSAFIYGDDSTRALLMLAGPITAIPLLLFAAAARQIPLYLLGFLQYIGPTLQMLLGVFLWHESFALSKIIGFAIIWSALGIFSIESILFTRRKKASPTLIV